MEETNTPPLEETFHNSDLPVETKKSQPVFIVLLLILLAFLISAFLLYRNLESIKNSQKEFVIPQPTLTTTVSENYQPIYPSPLSSPLPSPSPSPAVLSDRNTIQALDVNAAVKIPFIRNGNIYLYEDGIEKTIAKPTHSSVKNHCFNLVNPTISFDGRYIAYIEQVGDEPGYGGCVEGVVRVVDISTDKDYVTNIKTGYTSFFWSSQSILQLSYVKDNKFTFAEYYPIERKLVDKLSIELGQEDSGYRGFPLASNGKSIIFEEGSFYLSESGKKNKLIDQSEVRNFRGWSPDGKYALFDMLKQTAQNETWDSSMWLAIDVTSAAYSRKEILIYHGAAGGDFSIGTQWLFNEGLVTYCSSHMSFLVGREPRQLLSRGGGGCNNEDGFVTTSPNGSYALVNMWTDADHSLELYESNSSNKVLSINTDRRFNRITWINNDYAVLYESVWHQPRNNDNRTFIYLFDRKKADLKPVISNGYLRTTDY